MNCSVDSSKDTNSATGPCAAAAMAEELFSVFLMERVTCVNSPFNSSR